MRDFLQLKSALQTSPAVRLLRSPHAAMTLSFLKGIFKTRHMVSVPRSELVERLNQHIDDLRQSDLQLLVVSPLDKMHVVEPFIRGCHFVTNTQEEDNSKVFNLTIEEYHEQKKAYRHTPVVG